MQGIHLFCRVFDSRNSIFIEKFFNSAKRFTVKGAGTVKADGSAMFFGGISFIGGEIILRELLMKIHHHAIPADFGEYGGSSDGNAFKIAFDDRLLRNGRIESDGIDQEEIGGRKYLSDGLNHGPPGSFQDIDFIDEFKFCGGDAVSFRFLTNLIEEEVSF